MNTAALPGGKQCEHRGQVAPQSDGDEGQLHPAVFEVLAVQQGLHARDVQVEALQGEQREKQPSLPAGEGRRETGPRSRGCGGEGQHARTDVGVFAFLVGGVVMLVVFAFPPAVAQPGEQPGQYPGHPRVPSGGDEHLPVRQVVAEETELGGHHREDRRRDQRPPRVAHHEYGHPDQGERDKHRDDPGPIEPVPAARQSLVLDGAGQFRVDADVALAGGLHERSTTGGRRSRHHQKPSERCGPLRAWAGTVSRKGPVEAVLTCGG